MKKKGNLRTEKTINNILHQRNRIWKHMWNHKSFTLNLDKNTFKLRKMLCQSFLRYKAAQIVKRVTKEMAVITFKGLNCNRCRQNRMRSQIWVNILSNWMRGGIQQCQLIEKLREQLILNLCNYLLRYQIQSNQFLRCSNMRSLKYIMDRHSLK